LIVRLGHIEKQAVFTVKGVTLSFGDLKVGDQILAGGNRQGDGSLLALKIEVVAPKR